LATPSVLATNAPYSLEVAQLVNTLAASLALELVGIARDQEYSHEVPLSVFSWGAKVKPTLSATLLWDLSVTNEPATLASTQIAHLPLLNSARFSLKPLLDAPGGPDFFMLST